MTGSGAIRRSLIIKRRMTRSAYNPPCRLQAEKEFSACPGEVESGSSTRTCANTGIYGVFRSYGITE
jgi:hypothetical protein